MKTWKGYRWKGYFGNHRKQLPVMRTTQGPIESITEAEVKTQLDEMATNKAREGQMFYQ